RSRGSESFEAVRERWWWVAAARVAAVPSPRQQGRADGFPIRFPARERPAGFRAPRSDSGVRPAPPRSGHAPLPNAIAATPPHGWFAVGGRTAAWPRWRLE